MRKARPGDGAGSSPSDKTTKFSRTRAEIRFRISKLTTSYPCSLVLLPFFTARFSFMGSVQLPTVAVCSQQTGLQADLRTSLRFCNHSSDEVAISSADDIIRLRKDEKLWIIPAAGCRLRISLKLLGRVSGQSLAMNEVARWIERCDVRGNASESLAYSRD